MARLLYHPKKGSKCAFCKRWNGDANLVFKSPHTGFEYDGAGTFGICMITNGSKPSSGGAGCKHYEPSVEANRVL